MENSTSSLSNQSKSLVKDSDDSVFRLAEQSSAVIQFSRTFRPHGRDGVKNFIDYLRLLSKDTVPYPIAQMNIPPTNGSTTWIDKCRFVFNAPRDCFTFATAFFSVDMDKANVINVLYEDYNSSLRWKLVRGEDGKTSQVSANLLIPSAKEFVDKDPYKQLLERHGDGTRSPIGGPATPVKRLGEDEDESGKKKKSGDENSIGDIIVDDDSSEKKVGNEAAAATQPFPSIPSVKDKAAMKLDFPLTLVEATIRVQAIKEAILPLSRSLGDNPSPDPVEDMKKLKRDHSFIEEAIETFEVSAGELTWEEIVSIYRKKMEKMNE